MSLVRSDEADAENLQSREALIVIGGGYWQGERV